MIITLQDADFSTRNIGKIEVPRELNAFTLAAIEASGNTSMSKAQKIALDIFFEEVGAFGGKSNIWNKFDFAYIPFIADNLSKSMVDYKTNNVDFVPDATYWSMVNRGIKPSTNVPSTSGFTKEDYVFDQNSKSLVVLNTENLLYSGTSSETSLGVGTSANKTLNSYKNWGINAYGATHAQASVFIRFGAGSQAYSTILEGTDKADARTTRVISCDGTNIYALMGDGQYKTSILSAEQKGQRDTEPHKLFLFGSWTSAAISNTKTAAGALLLGSYLTQTEMQTVKSALDNLWEKFK